MRISVYTAENDASAAPLAGVSASDGVAAETLVCDIATIATAHTSAAKNRTRVFIAAPPPTDSPPIRTKSVG